MKERRPYGLRPFDLRLSSRLTNPPRQPYSERSPDLGALMDQSLFNDMTRRDRTASFGSSAPVSGMAVGAGLLG